MSSSPETPVRDETVKSCVTDAMCLAALKEDAAQRGENFDAMWEQMNARDRATLLSDWRHIIGEALRGIPPATGEPEDREEIIAACERNAIDRADAERIAYRLQQAGFQRAPAAGPTLQDIHNLPAWDTFTPYKGMTKSGMIRVVSKDALVRLFDHADGEGTPR